MSTQPEADQIIDMVQYLRDTIAEVDSSIREFQARREGLAERLAVLEAATDPEILGAVADYEERIAGNRPYEGAEPAEAVLSEALRKFGPQ